MKVANLQDKRKQVEREHYKVLVLKAWDEQMPTEERRLYRLGKPQRLDTDPEVRRKAKQQL
ncbi:hypothetical protein [Delftia sp. UGAL515B_04]|uniref:hypothetical protein n=1 Tax=Delftia sp. UGAL515B_04 TaxID=2986766 RepID=UPI0029547BA5|nr:hypothetical protein [Delftia sp. UGAL515B_04]WON88694.1 hypothetical protein OK021_28890 [Delftia sp. UGAL515B_04]